MRQLWKRLLRTFIYLGFLALTGFLRRVSYPLARRLGRGIGALAYGLFPRERRLALKQLSLAFPEVPPRDRERLVISSFSHLGEAAVELLHAQRWVGKGRITVEGLEDLRAARKAQGGVVVATGHFGNWELMALEIACRGLPVTVIARRIYDDRLDRWMRAFRESFGIRTIVREDPRAVFEILKALKRGDLVGILFDLDTQVESESVPFFGIPARTPVAPVRFALKGYPLFFASIMRVAPGEHRIRFLPVPVHGVGEGLSALNRLLEEEIRHAPEQWIWFQPRWKERLR